MVSACFIRLLVIFLRYILSINEKNIDNQILVSSLVDLYI